MQLYYFKHSRGNFGDDLNPWLWERLLPGFFDGDPNAIFVGIGTLLNHRLPAAPLKHVFGSGYGYGTPPVIDDRFIVHAVRGPHTAQVLHLDARTVITDSAVLLHVVQRPKAERISHKFGFIPHYASGEYFDWERVCDRLGFKYIDVQQPVDAVLREMTACATLVCESMHGAIVADTLRIPWIPVVCYDFISEFKWRDWLATLAIPYRPHYVTSLYDADRNHGPIRVAKNSIKRGLRRIGVWSREWTSPPPPRTGPAELDRATGDLQSAANGVAQLSERAILESHIARYLELLDGLRQAHSAANPRTANS